MTSLSLARGIQFGDLALTDYPFLTEFGMDYSAGDLVTSVLSSFLQDGDLEVSQRRGNMTLTIPLLIEGTDLLELAQAEAALALEAQKATNTLTIIPGDGFGPPTVFDTFEADVSFQFDDKLEQAAMRRLVLTIRALPFGRSTAEVVTQSFGAPPVTPSTASVNDASSGTGWTKVGGGSVVASGGRVSVSGGTPNPLGSANLGITLTQSFDSTGTPYIYVDWSCPVAFSPPGLSVDGLPAAEGAQVALAGGLIRSYFKVPAAAHTTLTFGTTVPYNSAASLQVDQVSRTNTLPTLGTAKQQARTVMVAGSARSQGTIIVASPTSSLGDVLLYTHSGMPEGYSPELRPYLLSGSSQTADSATVAGTTRFNGAANFDIPMTALAPGLYAVIARVKGVDATVRSVNFTAQAKVGSTAVGRSVTGSANFAGTGNYQFLNLGTANLPTTAMQPGTAGVQNIFIGSVGSGTSPYIDGVYLLNLSLGRLTMVACGSGTAAAGGSSSRLWLNTASLTSLTPTIMRGFAADGSDAFYAGDDIVAAGVHEAAPPNFKALVVTTNATDAQVSFRQYPRWLGHAAS